MKDFLPVFMSSEVFDYICNRAQRESLMNKRLSAAERPGD